MHRSLAGSEHHGRRRRAACVLLLSMTMTPAFAEDVRGRGLHGSYALTYQYVRESEVPTNIGHLDIGTSDTQALLLDVDLLLSDKWEFYASLPFVMKRYNGDSPHDPHSLDGFDVDEPFIDDGDYHGDFQDLAFGFRYSLVAARVQVQPFLGASIPTNDYPIFAHAAVGQHLRRVDAGVRINYVPPFSDFYYSFSLTRAFVERVQDVNVDHWRFDGEIGYFVNPRLTVRGYFLTRQGNGLEFPDDFPAPRNDLHWYEHEGLLAREYVIVGVGADWSLNERVALTMSVITSVHEKFIHQIDHGITVGVVRRF